MADNFFRNPTRPMIFDGATGTQLQKRGMPAGSCSEKWLLEHPEAIDFQTKYAQSGADAVYAPTFGANRALLSRHGLGDKVAEYNRALVELSRKAVGDNVRVGGDISSTCVVYGSATEAEFEQMVEIYSEQVEALEAAGVDFYAVETQSALSETRAALTAVHALSKKPVLVSYTMNAAGRSFSGGAIPAALLASLDMGIDAFGINCVDDPELIARTLAELRPMTDLPLLVKPNAGLPEMIGDKAVYDLSPVTMGEMAERFYDLGADFFGGCCGSDENHIAAISAALSGRTLPKRPAPEGKWICSEYAVLPLTGSEKAAELTLDDNFEDNAAELTDEGAQLLRVRAENAEQLSLLLASQGSVKLPLQVSFGEEGLRERFLRYYAGRALLC